MSSFSIYRNDDTSFHFIPDLTFKRTGKRKYKLLNRIYWIMKNIYNRILEILHLRIVYITGRYKDKIFSTGSGGTSLNRILFKLSGLVTLFEENNITYKLYNSQKVLLTDSYITKYLIGVHLKLRAH